VIDNLSIAGQRFLGYPFRRRGIHVRGGPCIALSRALLSAAERTRWLLLQFSHDFVACLILAPFAKRVHTLGSCRWRLPSKQPFIFRDFIKRRHLVHQSISYCNLLLVIRARAVIRWPGRARCSTPMRSWLSPHACSTQSSMCRSESCAHARLPLRRRAQQIPATLHMVLVLDNVLLRDTPAGKRTQHSATGCAHRSTFNSAQQHCGE
jgi:hypothetical protein